MADTGGNFECGPDGRIEVFQTDRLSEVGASVLWLSGVRAKHRGAQRDPEGNRLRLGGLPCDGQPEAVGTFSFLVVLATRDVAASAAFYRQTLGLCLRAEWKDKDGCFACLAPSLVGQSALLLTDGAFAREQQNSFCLLEAREIDTLYSAVCAAGGKILEELHCLPFGVRRFCVADPAGNRVGVYQPIP